MSESCHVIGPGAEYFSPLSSHGAAIGQCYYYHHFPQEIGPESLKTLLCFHISRCWSKG